MVRPPTDTDDMPWLAEGVREERSTLVPRARLFGGGLIAVALAGLVGIGVYLAASHKSDGSGGYARPEDAPLIAADTGAYKVAPADPGGAPIAGIDDSVAVTARGGDQGSAILPEEPEEPLARPGPNTAPASSPSPTNLLPPTSPPPAAVAITPSAIVPPAARTDLHGPKTDAAEMAKAEVAKPKSLTPPAVANVDPVRSDAKPVRSKPRFDDPLAADPATTTAPGRPAKGETSPAAGSGGTTLQLGAFSTRDKADAAWAKLGSDGALSGLAKRIEPVEHDGTTLYRLRAAGVASHDAARALCGRIKAAGAACIVAD